MRPVAVLETDPTGHRLRYLRHLYDALGADRCVVLTSDTVLGSVEYAEYVGDTAPETVVLASAASYRDTLEAAVAAAASAGATRLVVPDGDRYLTALVSLLLRRPRLPVPVRLLLMRTTTLAGPERVRPATLVKPLLVQLLRARRDVDVLFLTDALGVVTARPGYPGVRGVKDPVEPPSGDAGPRPPWLPAPVDDHLLVGVFGVISPRKNLPLLVDALVDQPDVRVVVGGRLEPEVRGYVDASPQAAALCAAGRLTVVDRLLESDELAAALASVDLVAVLHDNDSPSGILAEACAWHTPVLVPEGAWLDRVATSTGVGVAVPLTPAGIADGVRRVVRERARYAAAAARESARLGTAAFTDALVND